MEHRRDSKSNALTLVQVVCVVACALVLIVVLFPVFSNVHVRQPATSDLSNIKQHGIAVQMYLADYDNRLPLGHGISEADGTHGYNYYKYVPANWSENPSPNRLDYSRSFVLNSLQVYLKNYQIMAAPRMDDFEIFENEIVAEGERIASTTYAYNGYLHAYDFDEIVSVENLPLFTAANGNRAGVGIGFANPALDCATPYAPCIYKPRTDNGCETGNGGTGSMYTKYDGSNSSYWLYKRGQNWAHTDSHAKFRRYGKTLAPNDTDWHHDPWTGYDSDGHADTFWWNGCHAWLFRPDYSFPD